MSAPSSEQEAREIAREIEARPRLQAVTDRMLQVIESLKPGENRRIGLECCLASLGVGLRPGEDITEKERDDWMAALEERTA